MNARLLIIIFAISISSFECSDKYEELTFSILVDQIVEECEVNKACLNARLSPSSNDVVQYGFVIGLQPDPDLINTTPPFQITFEVPKDSTIEVIDNIEWETPLEKDTNLYYIRAFAKLQIEDVDDTRVVYSDNFNFSFDAMITIIKEVEINNDVAKVEGVISGIEGKISVTHHGHIFSFENSIPIMEEVKEGTSDTTDFGSMGSDGSFISEIKNLIFRKPLYIRSYLITRDDRIIYSTTHNFEIPEGWKTKEVWNDRSEFLAPFNLGFYEISLGASINDETAYLGIGTSPLSSDLMYKRVFEFTPEGDVHFREMDPFPGDPRIRSISCSVGSVIYYGLGVQEGPQKYFNDLYKFDPLAARNSQWKLIDTFPGNRRASAVAFSIEGDLYIGTGEDKDQRYDDFYKYSPENQKWDTLPTLPILLNNNTNITFTSGRANAVSFVIDGQAYVGLGDSGIGQRDLWLLQKEPIYKWVLVDDLIPRTESLERGTAFVIDSLNRAYIATGFAKNKELAEFWEFDPDNRGMDPWTKKNPPFQGEPRAWAISFTIGGKAYVGMGRQKIKSIQTPLPDIWEYTPLKSVN